MRGEIVDAVKDELLVEDRLVKGITPVPGIVLDDAMGINLDPEVEKDERGTADPAEEVPPD